jgi:hypothetical protein
MAPKNEDMSIEQKVNEIHSALCGNAYQKEGMIDKVERHDKTIRKHDLYFGIMVGLGSLMVLLAAFWSDIKSIF